MIGDLAHDCAACGSAPCQCSDPTLRTVDRRAVLRRGAAAIAAVLAPYLGAVVAVERARNAAQALADGAERPELVLAELLIGHPIAAEPFFGHVIKRAARAWKAEVGT